MKYKKYKKFILVFVLVILLFSFLLPNICSYELYAETNGEPQTTTRKKSVGHKVEGARHYDEMFEGVAKKYNIIITDMEGNNGEGGGANGNTNQNAGNNGNESSSGGIGGDAVSKGTGEVDSDNNPGRGGSDTNVGTGQGTKTGSSGLDAIRALRERVEKSKQESIDRMLETAENRDIAEESIRKRESEQESIKKRLAKESIRNKLFSQEKPTEKTYYMPNVDLIVPTAGNNNYDKNNIPTAAKNSYDKSIIPTAVNNEYDKNVIPTAGNIIINNIFEENSIMPTAIENIGDNNIIETYLIPTAKETEEQIITSEMEIVPTFETEETFETEVTFETEELTETSPILQDNEVYEIVSEEGGDNREEGIGDIGGENPNEFENLENNDEKNESQGNAIEKGAFQSEKTGNHKGKKVFEIDTNGNFGFNDEHLGFAINPKYIIALITTILFILGAITYFIKTKDKKNKKNYF